MVGAWFPPSSRGVSHGSWHTKVQLAQQTEVKHWAVSLEGLKPLTPARLSHVSPTHPVLQQRICCHLNSFSFLSLFLPQPLVLRAHSWLWAQGSLLVGVGNLSEYRDQSCARCVPFSPYCHFNYEILRVISLKKIIVKVISPTHIEMNKAKLLKLYKIINQ